MSRYEEIRQKVAAHSLKDRLRAAVDSARNAGRTALHHTHTAAVGAGKMVGEAGKGVAHMVTDGVPAGAQHMAESMSEVGRDMGHAHRLNVEDYKRRKSSAARMKSSPPSTADASAQQLREQAAAMGREVPLRKGLPPKGRSSDALAALQRLRTQA